LSITVAVTMLKSKAPEYSKFDTQTLELRRHIATTIDAISPDHWVRPKKNELFADPETAPTSTRSSARSRKPFRTGIFTVKCHCPETFRSFLLVSSCIYLKILEIIGYFPIMKFWAVWCLEP